MWKFNLAVVGALALGAGLTADTNTPAKSQSEQHAETVEKITRKLRAGMTPPPGAPRPEVETPTDFVTALETAIDTAAVAHPNPGRRTFQRLNRAEYARSIHELLGLDVDV